MGDPNDPMLRIDVWASGSLTVLLDCDERRRIWYGDDIVDDTILKLIISINI